MKEQQYPTLQNLHQARLVMEAHLGWASCSKRSCHIFLEVSIFHVFAQLADVDSRVASAVVEQARELLCKGE